MAVAPVLANEEASTGDLVTLYDFIGALRKRLILIAAITIACGGGMAIVAFTMTPVYRSRVVLAPVTETNKSITDGLGGQLGGGLISALTGDESERKMQTDEEITVLGSREFTEKFINDYDLLPVLFSNMWDARAHRWKQGLRRIPTLERGYVEFDKIRKIDFDASDEFVTLQIDWTDRFKAAEWANRMAERLNDELRDRAVRSAESMLAYLQTELENTSGVEARAAIGRLMEGQIKKKMLAHVSPEFEVRVVDKAMVSDLEYPQRPMKILMIGIGVLLGFLLSVAVSLWLYRRELTSRGFL
jgi:uncharacterized protein involved in exopolysaccharide biosynthesis